MKVSILFFGQTAELAGSPRIEHALEPSATIKDVVDFLVTRNPRFRAASLLYALNQEYVSSEASISDGDELAIFTPVSGG